MYARLCPVYGWTEVDLITGEVGPFVLSNAIRNYGMIYGVTRAGILTGRPQVEFDAVSIDGIEWLPVKENISLLPLENADVHQTNRDVVLGNQS